MDQIGIEASTTIEAASWRRLQAKAALRLTQSGPDGRMMDSEILVFDRGVEEVDW